MKAEASALAIEPSGSGIADIWIYKPGEARDGFCLAGGQTGWPDYHPTIALAFSPHPLKQTTKFIGNLNLKMSPQWFAFLMKTSPERGPPASAVVNPDGLSFGQERINIFT